MHASDLRDQLAGNLVPAVLLISCVFAASILWKRTQLASALAQLLSASLVFVSCAVFVIRTWVGVSSRLGRLLWSSAAQIGVCAMLLSGFVGFVAGYLWFALTQKASNQAIQPTADRHGLRMKDQNRAMRGLVRRRSS